MEFCDLGFEFFFSKYVQCVSGEQTLLEEYITSPLNKLCSDVHRTTFQVIFAPISVQLEQVQSAPAWSSVNKQATSVAADLPDFSFAPQEYITQVSLKVATHTRWYPKYSGLVPPSI
jgi:hypothetical protein